MSESNVLRSCKQEDCNLIKTGFCLESLSPEQCSHSYLLSSEQEKSVIFDIDSDSSLLETDIYKFFHGDELKEAEIGEVTSSVRSNLILILGEPNSGKTTLISSLYDKFQKGPFSDFCFAGSRTHIGYEKRCHKLRVASGLIKAEMDRTSTRQFQFLHLSVKKIPLLEPIQHILFTDISGERFKQARDNDEEMKQLKHFSFADHIFFLVDGESLADKRTRSSARQNVMNLLGRAEQTQMLILDNQINIAITKWDKVISLDAADSIDSYFVKPILRRFERFIKEIIQISAQSENDQVVSGTGLNRVLEICLSKDRRANRAPAIDDLVDDGRQFQRFRYRDNA